MHLEQQPQFIIVLSFSSLLGRSKVKEMQPSFCLKDETIYPAWACHVVQGCRNQRPPPRPPLGFFADQFTSFQPGTFSTYVSPQIFKPSYYSESCILTSIVYDRNHLFGLGPILKPKLKVGCNFRPIPKLTKTDTKT